MFILCFFFLNGILVFTSGGGNRALSGRATGGETIHRSLRSGAQTSRKSPSLLNFSVWVPCRTASCKSRIGIYPVRRSCSPRFPPEISRPTVPPHGVLIPLVFVSRPKSVRSNRSKTLHAFRQPTYQQAATAAYHV